MWRPLHIPEASAHGNTRKVQTNTLFEGPIMRPRRGPSPQASADYLLLTSITVAEARSHPLRLPHLRPSSQANLAPSLGTTSLPAKGSLPTIIAPRSKAPSRPYSVGLQDSTVASRSFRQPSPSAPSSPPRPPLASRPCNLRRAPLAMPRAPSHRAPSRAP